MASLAKQNIYLTAQRRVRRRFLLLGLAVLALFCLFLCMRSTCLGLLSPVQTAKNLYAAAKLLLARWLKWSIYDQRSAIIADHTAYLETLTRLNGGVLIVILGAVLALAGTVFQCVFRNPIAGPNLLGISSGISIGNLLLVVQYSSLAVSMTSRRFLYGYGCSLGLLGLIFLVGLLAGRGKGSVIDMLLTGCILSRVATRLISTAQYYWLDETEYLVLQEMSLYGTGIGNAKGAIFLLAALLLGMVPLVLMRSSLNLVTFSDEEARGMGLSIGWLRLLGLVCSTILMIAAQIHCGEMGMLAMLTPHLCRYLFGSNTKDLVAGSLLTGALIMLACRIIAALFAFHPFLKVVSLSTLVSLISMPLMMVVMLKYRRGWS